MAGDRTDKHWRLKEKENRLNTKSAKNKVTNNEANKGKSEGSIKKVNTKAKRRTTK